MKFRKKNLRHTSPCLSTLECLNTGGTNPGPRVNRNLEAVFAIDKNTDLDIDMYMNINRDINDIDMDKFYRFSHFSQFNNFF